MSGDFAEGHRTGPKRQRRRHDDEAHCFVENNGFERRETKHTNEQRQTELCPAQADQPAECSDDTATEEGGGQIAGIRRGGSAF